MTYILYGQIALLVLQVYYVYRALAMRDESSALLKDHLIALRHVARTNEAKSRAASTYELADLIESISVNTHAANDKAAQAFRDEAFALVKELRSDLLSDRKDGDA